jgi:lipoprotein-anchoring transpeptidase ErfK/SrfK
MGRSSRHSSRVIAGLLLVVVVLGLVSVMHRTERTKADPAPVNTGPANPPATRPESTPAQDSQPRTTITPQRRSEPSSPQPTTGPSTQPAQARIPVASKTALADASALRAAGKTLQARKILNDALLSGTLSAPEADAARAQIAELNQSIIFSTTRFADDEFGGTYSVQPGDVLQRIASRFDVTPEVLQKLNGLSDPRKLRAGATIKVIRGPFHAVVSKKRFEIDLYIGSLPGVPATGTATPMYVRSFRVGLGKDDSTPVGLWKVKPQNKLRNPTYYSPRGEGIIDADDPENPLGERWIGLEGIDGHAVGKESYGIHGTIDPKSIGKMESMGCIRLLNEDVEWVFDLLTEGKSYVQIVD